ncbi:MAG: hypothetical protein QXN26_04315 [Thermoplasmataceae archaeon]
MLDLSYYLSGLATVLAVFILIVGVRAYRKSRIRILAYLVAVFALFLLDSTIYTISGLIYIQSPFSFADIFLLTDVAVLLLFYFGTVRGS